MFTGPKDLTISKIWQTRNKNNERNSFFFFKISTIQCNLLTNPWITIKISKLGKVKFWKLMNIKRKNCKANTSCNIKKQKQYCSLLKKHDHNWDGIAVLKNNLLKNPLNEIQSRGTRTPKRPVAYKEWAHSADHSHPLFSLL